jgi:hypothetical protein
MSDLKATGANPGRRFDCASQETGFMRERNGAAAGLDPFEPRSEGDEGELC